MLLLAYLSLSKTYFLAFLLGEKLAKKGRKREPSIRSLFRCERKFWLMAPPATNWLSFSLSPMETLKTSSPSATASAASHLLPFDQSAAAAPLLLFDNLYCQGSTHLLFSWVLFSFHCFIARTITEYLLWSISPFLLVLSHSTIWSISCLWKIQLIADQGLVPSWVQKISRNVHSFRFLCRLHSLCLVD